VPTGIDDNGVSGEQLMEGIAAGLDD
jgi:hypothetical protein